MTPADRADRRQRFAARVRRTPGYRAVRDGVVPRLRASSTLTDLVWRVFTPDHELGAARRAFRADRLQTPDAERLPIVAFSVLALDEKTAHRALEAIADLEDRTAAFRAVVVVDRPVLAEVRRLGLVADHVIPRADWYGDPDGYGGYVGRRLVSVIQGFRVWHLVHVGLDGQVPEADLRLLHSIRGAMAGAADPPVGSSPGRPS